MSQPSINPVAKSLYLCDRVVGHGHQKTDLFGLFNSSRSTQFPHMQTTFIVFAQLLGGLGQVPFYIDIRYAADETLIYTSNPRTLFFPSRDHQNQVACTIENCIFPRQGIYLVEFFCNGQWTADTTLRLL